MPWQGKEDVGRHNKRCAEFSECRKLWLRVANEYYHRTGDDGQAVIRANVAAKKWLQSHGKYNRNPLTRFKCNGCGEVFEGEFPSGPLNRWFSIHDEDGDAVGVTGPDPDSVGYLIFCSSCSVDTLRDMLNSGNSLPNPGRGGWVR